MQDAKEGYPLLASPEGGGIERAQLGLRPLAQATIAQLVEQCFRKAEVLGSTPSGGSRGCARIPSHFGRFVIRREAANRRFFCMSVKSMFCRSGSGIFLNNP